MFRLSSVLLCLLWCTSIHTGSLDSSPALLAQDVEIDESDDEVSIEEESDEDEQKSSWDQFVEFWNKHFKLGIGTASGVYFNTSSAYNGYRLYHFAYLSFDYSPWEWWNIKLEGEIYRSDIRLALELDIDENPITREMEEPPERGSNNICKGGGFAYCEGRWVPTLRDSFFQFDITQYARLTIGRKTVIWGQFDIVSPIDITLPIRIQSQGLAFGKSSSRIPQDVLILGFYPLSNIEIEGYYFPRITLDKTTEDALRNLPEQMTFVWAIDPKGNLMPSQQEVGGVYIPTSFKNLDKNYQLAARTLFYLDFMTIGFTYFSYFYTFNRSNYASLEAVTGNNLEGEMETRYYRKYNYKLPRSNTWGLEISVPIQKWVIKVESALSSRVEDITTSFDAGKNDVGYSQTIALIDLISNENSKLLLLNHYEIVSGIGVDADLDRWVFNLLLLNIRYIYFGKAKRARDLITELNKVEGTEQSGGIPPVLPFVNIGWYAMPNKKATLGILGGLIGSLGFGASIYFTQKLLDDDFRYAVSLDALNFNSDALIEIVGAKLRDPFIIGLRVILTYAI